MRRTLLTLLAAAAIGLALLAGTQAAVGQTGSVTYTATQTTPVPPASSYAGSAGGDGWAVALTPTAF